MITHNNYTYGPGAVIDNTGTEKLYQISGIRRSNDRCSGFRPSQHADNICREESEVYGDLKNSKLSQL